MSPLADNTALLATYSGFPFPLVAGRDEQVFGADGEAWLDLYGGHCVALTGHGHPRVVAAVSEQVARLAFYSMAASLPVRDQAAEALCDFAPDGLDQVFFCNSGAEANENALRIAAMLTGRDRFVAFEGGFHGRTQLALSVSDVPGLHAKAPGLRAEASLLPFADHAALAAADFSDVAAVIVEPIQSMAGVRAADTAWLRALEAKCRANGCLLIFDEIQTGMGRLGTPFAADLHGIRPDLMTLAKGMASGLPMGAVLMQPAVAGTLAPGDLGSTFGGGPLACAALLATLKIIREEHLMCSAAQAEQAIRRGLKGSVVSAVRGHGLLLGLVAGTQAASLKDWLQSRNILVGGSADPGVLRLMPPLTLSPRAVATLITAVHAFSADARQDAVPFEPAKEASRSCHI
ncbi:aspartate aminotransferase family protein [Natronospira sp.]|uniref:aspartate aminotransferase family protein n=1 Tax=Natronospira sp. TaxID=2024970 RepID=UPI00387361B8